ncbi:F-box/LRR-repeat protein, partial [Trifolium medium]|nr:F-box/LRR-repeat protein [Trifolium medium]
MAASNFYLPDDCWESVFKFLNHDSDNDNSHRHLKSLSLVSKQFLSITNGLRFSLNVINPTRPYLHYLLTRFTNLTSLNLTCFRGDLDALLSLISFFRLNLTSLNISNQPAIPANGLRAFSLKITTLTSLTCSKIDSINSSDLFLIADCFPLLEELDLSNPRKSFVGRRSLRHGLETLSLALFKLRKVNLSGHNYINNQYLLHLFKNCKLLEEVILFDYTGLTSAGIASSLRERPTL